jgi:hypothetical protein
MTASDRGEIIAWAVERYSHIYPIWLLVLIAELICLFVSVKSAIRRLYR